MIVPGEASESDEDEHTQSSVPPNVVPILPRSAVAQTPSPTASQGATIASQLTSKVNSVTEAAVKQLGNLSRQVRLATLLLSNVLNFQWKQEPVVLRILKQNRAQTLAQITYSINLPF